MSKTPAKPVTTKKPAAKASASAKKTVKPAAKAAKATKPATKPAAKPVAKSKPAAKPAAKHGAKPAAKHATKPAAKPSAKAPARAPVKSAAKPTAKAPIKAPAKAAPAHAAHGHAAHGHHAAAVKPHAKPTPAPAPLKTATPVAAKPVAHVPPTRPASSRSSRHHPTAPAAAPLPPPTSRFADRFAPPRPPTRQMNNLEVDTVKHAHKADPKLANAWKTKSGKDLSEAEILAMPDAEYMNDKQLEFFRGRLQMLKDDLLSNAVDTTEHLREDTSIVPDPADRATIEEEHALELRTRDRERKLLKKISQSLARIDAGDYGFCDETGEPIGLGRLIARPTATLSLEAQQRRELKQKMFGD